MEIILIAIAVVLIGAVIYYNQKSKSFDVNHDGKVDITDAKVAVQNVAHEVKINADVNKDGKVDVADVKVVAQQTKQTVEKVAAKVEKAVKAPRKTTGKKTPAKKSTPKKQ